MNKQRLVCKVASIGAWGSKFEHWPALRDLLAGGQTPEETLKGPKPQVIPANERRRAPLPVRLAVESAWQATQAVNIDPKTLNCVFVSGLGDTQLTDYMCKVLASENKQLSPTKFHNSVHNAPAGYWTISTESMGAANSVAGFEQSVSLTLMEAMIQCHLEQQAVLITCYDAPVSPVLSPLLENQEPFSLSLVIFPEHTPDEQNILKEAITMEAEVSDESLVDWPILQTSNTLLQNLYQTNPCARILALLEVMADKEKWREQTVMMPLSEGTSIRFSFS